VPEVTTAMKKSCCEKSSRSRQDLHRTSHDLAWLLKSEKLRVQVVFDFFLRRRNG
jgi:hypothetical protein